MLIIALLKSENQGDILESTKIKGVVFLKKLTKKMLAVFLSALMAVSAVSVPISSFAAEKKPSSKAEYVEGEAIAVLKNSAPKTYLTASKSVANFGRGIKLNKSFTFNKKNGAIRAVVLKSDKSTQKLLKELRANDAVEYAFPNYKVKATSITKDAYSDFQWALDNKGQNEGTQGLDANADALWEKAAASEKEQIVAVVDTGIDYNHEDLKDIVWENPFGSRLVGKHGYDFSNTIKDHTPYDDNGHGSHVAGIIAGAADNEKGISGINKSNVKIMACKFLDEEGSGETEGALAAYEYINRAVDLGANVVAVNNSWGGIGDEYEMKLFDEIFNELGKKGVVTLAAAGNEAQDLEKLNEDEEINFLFDGEEVFDVPACSSSKYCLTVAASNEKDELGDFSNYGAKYVDIAAPGCDILSSVSYNCFNPTLYNAEERGALCADFQDYEGEISSSDFGYPVNVELKTEGFEDLVGKNIQIAQINSGFDMSSKSIAMTFKDEVEEEDARYYAIELPYSIKNEDDSYSLSFMYSGNKKILATVCDVPADFDVATRFDELDYLAMIGGGEKGNYWDHFFIDINPSDKYYDKKMKSKERKLVLAFESYEADSVFKIDDFAVSVQGANADDFKKYDFYNGTSMATPYAAGAVALVKNAYPNATAAEVINIVKNTGRIVPEYEGKIESSRVLSLENSEKTPAILISAAYNKDGDIEVEGSFKGETTFKINGKAVTPKSVNESKAVFTDNGYNTKKNTFEAANEYGADSLSVLLSNKPLPKKSSKVVGMPGADTELGYYMPKSMVSIPAGTVSYFVGETGNIGKISYDDFEKAYVYDDFIPQIDFTNLFKSINSISVKDAVYLNGRIYFTAVNSVVSAYSSTVLGYDSAFGYLDLTSGKTVLLCEFPNASNIGDSLAVYNGNILLLGGYNEVEGAFSKDVYRYNSTKKAFEKLKTTLPEGRAFTRFIQYGNKLYGFLGANESKTMPSTIVLESDAWSINPQKLESDDYDEYAFDEDKSIKVYSSSVGYGSGGIYLSGAYIYGLGDTYYFSTAKNKLLASKYTFSNEIGEKDIIATTLPGAFIAFEMTSEGEEELDIETEDEEEPCAYFYSITNTYATIDESALSHAYVSNAYEDYYSYGDKASIKLSPESGYVITSISANGKQLSTNSNKATLTINAQKIALTAKTKKVAPNKVTGLKVTSSKKKYNLTWKKPSRAEGYQVQTYVNGKWKTLKTVNSANTLKYSVSKSKAGKKFRVRAFAKYNSKTYYGAWSSTVKVK